MDIGTGTSIAFASGFFAEILDVSPPGATRKSIETSHMGTTDDHTFMPGDLVDRGEAKIEMAFDPATEPPIDQPAESCTITFPDGSTWTFTAFMTGYDPKVPLEDRMTASATLKVTGGVTVGGGASV